MALGRPIRVQPITALPEQFAVLRSEAAADGFTNMEALLNQWEDGSNRFTQPGELLAMASIDGSLAGIGGVTEDFIDPSALRMRRFYVRAAYRRRGVGRAIAKFVLRAVTPLGRQIFLHTETAEGAAFWESLGFAPIEREKTTHVLVG